ncbi:cytoplasmic protein [Coprinopsis cinerea okayama7|uniref:Cytoplasmic protein n=1 Tax=Coprinopsis cinerea (strain Okayama-7 / 130 / ATCC MYA-4618 / FGSC 9003) TaxID=240176 RepID=A8P9X2_COPC7|nr:cytoplasmic protein [Coprinopsis cinerea okayama7\|eukprot:XP_001839861.1 cytoplasmic protein [Coprinopsis cinerea okayama7\
MPRVPSTSPATGQPVPPSYIHTFNYNFVDTSGRTLLLRGVNLSGASKAPVGHLSHQLDDFWDSAEAGGESFIRRPLNLDDGSADVHLARLRGWGFNMLRFPITWEALEHEGPGKYDDEFIDYTIRVLQKCRDYGFRVFMDPHQDTWSRFSGGSGAPFWTLAACGINPNNITATQSAIVHCEYPLAHAPDPASLPAMIWSTNYGRLLSQTLFTLFFAGRTFAPLCVIDDLNIQDYLQNHYIEAFGRLADRIREIDPSLYDNCIIGWDSLNEPFEGLCGWENLNANPTAQGSTLKKGTYPTPAQSLRLGMGQPQTVENWSFGAFGPSRNGSVTIDPKGHKLWAEDSPDARWGFKRAESWPLGTCIWALHNVWDIQTGYVLRPDYFKFHPETQEEVSFISDFWKPHFLAYSSRLRKSHPEAIWFVQPPVFAKPPQIATDDLRGRACYSPHYYDGLTLITRHWNWFNADALGVLRGKYSSPIQAVKIGESAIRASIQSQLGILKSDALILGDYPTLIGEIGIPFDMDDKRSYGWTDKGKYKGDYSRQVKALDASLNACDGPNGLNFTVWTFCPDDHSHEWGDGWNLEDLSLWSMADVWERERVEKEAMMVDEEDRKSVGTVSTSSVGSSSRESLGSGTAPAVQLDQGVSSNNNSRVSLVNRKNRKRRKDGAEQMKPSLAMVAAASSLSVATFGTVATASTLAGETSSPESRSKDIVNIKRTNDDNDTTSPTPSPALLASLGWHANPYDFLCDGARAVKAFSRPFPVKTVGTPKHIEFDVNKAVWKCTVVVTADDAPVYVKGVVEEGEGGETKKLGTEIYIPIVHFAHERLLLDGDAEGKRRRRRRVEGASNKKGEDGVVVQSDSVSTLSLREGGDEVTPTPSVDPTPQALSIPMVGAAPIISKTPSNAIRYTSVAARCPSEITLGAQPVVPYVGYSSEEDEVVEGAVDAYTDEDEPEGEDGGPLVDIEVFVSEGTWKVEGQALFWWYDVPEAPPSASSTTESLGLPKPPYVTSASTTSVNTLSSRRSANANGRKDKLPPGVKEVTIEIRRRGGVIKKEEEEGRKRRVVERGLRSGVYPSERVKSELRAGAKGRRKGDKGCCEELCSEGCVVM